jgi:hypothetical protein
MVASCQQKSFPRCRCYKPMELPRKPMELLVVNRDAAGEMNFISLIRTQPKAVACHFVFFAC